MIKALKNKATQIAQYALYGLPAYLAAQAVMAQTAVVTGAMTQNQAGLTAATASTVSQTGLTNLSEQVGDIIMFAAGFMGIALGVTGILKLHGHYKEGDQARGSATSYWLMAGAGGLLTMVAAFIALVPKLFVTGL